MTLGYGVAQSPSGSIRIRMKRKSGWYLRHNRLTILQECLRFIIQVCGEECAFLTATLMNLLLIQPVVKWGILIQKPLKVCLVPLMILCGLTEYFAGRDHKGVSSVVVLHYRSLPFPVRLAITYSFSVPLTLLFGIRPNIVREVMASVRCKVFAPMHTCSNWL